MNVLRRCGAALLLVCSVLGVALCLGGLIGVWVVHQPAKEIVGETLDTLDSYLTLANQTMQQVRERTTPLRATLEGARQELVADGGARRGAITARVTAALQEASSTLAALRDTVRTLSAGVATLNRTLGRQRLTAIVPPTVPDDLQALEQRLSSIGDRADALVATMADASLAVSTLNERVGVLAGELQDLDERLAQWSTRLATAQTATASAKANASTAIDLASVGLSLLLLLFGVGQVSLGLQAWRWLQARSSSASSSVITPVGASAG